MGKRFAICGRVANELFGIAAHHPRFGVTGDLSAPLTEKEAQFGGDGYRVACGLRALNADIRMVSVIGSDDTGKGIRAKLQDMKINCENLIEKEELRTAQMLYLIDKCGIVNLYAYDSLSAEGDISPDFFKGSELDYIILTEANSLMRRDMFNVLEQVNFPLFWYVQGQVCDLTPDNLLRYSQRSRYLIMSPHESHYFCNTLGLSSIDLLLKEGPRVIIVIEYEVSQGSYVFNVFTSERLETQQFSSITGHNVGRYRDIMLGFVIGFSYAAYEADEEIEVMLRAGITCAEEYLAHLDNPSYDLQYKNIVKKLHR